MNTNLKEIRRNKNITQKELSKLTGIAQTQISLYENGTEMSITNLVKICTALNTSADDLLGIKSIKANINTNDNNYTKEQLNEISETLLKSAQYFKNLINIKKDK